MLDADRALAILGEDEAYLHAVAEHGDGAELPSGRRNAAQRRLHGENVRALAA